MKKWVTIMLVGLLSVVLFLALAQAQQAQSPAAAKPNAQQKAASLQNTLACFETFMNGVLTKINANMDKIDTFNGKVSDLRNTVNAVSLEIKDAEGKIVGLHQEVAKLDATQKGYGDQITALETQLAALKKACDEVSQKSNVNQNDIAALKAQFAAFVKEHQAVSTKVQADIAALKKNAADLGSRVNVLEQQDVGTFKKKVIELERTVSALSIKIDDNRTKLEGVDQTISGFSAGIDANKKAILANKSLLSNHEKRIATLEKSSTQIAGMQDQLNSLYFISIVGLLAGVGALVWGFFR